jgi:hypothetical protein
LELAQRIGKLSAILAKTPKESRSMSKLLLLSARQRFAIWLVGLCLTFGCGPIRLVSAYDAVVDQSVSDLHTKVVAFVNHMQTLAGKPEGTYEANKAAYTEFSAATETLKLRASGDAKNGITVAMVGELQQNLDNLKKLHEKAGDGGLRPDLANLALPGLETSFKTIIEFEIAKKRDGLNQEK